MYYTVKEAAKYLGEGESTIYRKVRNKIIRGTKDKKGVYHISESELKRYKSGSKWIEEEVGYNRCALFGSKFDALRGYVDCSNIGNSIKYLYSDLLNITIDFVKYMVEERNVREFLLTGQFGFDLIALYALSGVRKEGGIYSNIKIKLCLPNSKCYDSVAFKNKEFNVFMRDVIAKKYDLGISVINVDEECSDILDDSIGEHKDRKIKLATEYIIDNCDYFGLMVNKLDSEDDYLFNKYVDYAKKSKNVKSIFDLPCR